ncbi:MAG: papain-like cysteine peptidase [Gammaproteobacteria bacterium]|nr:papain-like cysteine peptidase [Gammaproteobacteria bacterium]
MSRERLKKLRDQIKYLFFSGDRNTKKQRLDIAADVGNAITQFLGTPQHQAISLGQNCTSAWYLKQVEVKKQSYPFDWIISSAEVLESCLDDNFATFMNKEHMFSFDDGKRAGHKIYHEKLFNHRNPLINQQDYEYYQRCVTRFLNFLDSTTPVVFVCTLFQNTITDYHRCQEKMLARNPNIKFVFMEQKLKGEFNLFHKEINPHTLLIHFTSQDINRGKRYRNQLDDRVIKTVFSAFRQ